MCDGVAHDHPQIARAARPLVLVDWANDGGFETVMGENAIQRLLVGLEKRPARMAHSNATGRGLVSNGYLGVDLIRIAGGDGFVPHTHPGDHLLICVGGRGTITYDGRIHETRAGQVYMVEGMVPHAVGAITDHVILAVGAPHKAVDDTERMAPQAYASVLAETGSLHCLICDVIAVYPQRLHDVRCSHCPCAACNLVREVL